MSVLPAWLVGLHLLSGYVSLAVCKDISICLTVTLHKPVASEDGNLELFSSEAAAEAAAALRALRDVESRNCTLLHPNCERQLLVRGSEYVRLQPFLVDVRDSNSLAAPSAIFTCYQNGSHVALGLWNSALSMAGSFFSASYGLLVFGHRADSPALSIVERYPYFSRTIFSQALEANWLMGLFSHLGWQKVSILYERGELGESFVQAFQEEARPKGILVETVAAVDDAGQPTLQVPTASSALELIKQGSNKVIVLQIRLGFVVDFLNLAWELGLDIGSYVWVVATVPLQDVLREINGRGRDLPAGLFRGLLGVSIEPMDEALERLNTVHLSNFEEDEIGPLLHDRDGNLDPRMDDRVMDEIHRGARNMQSLYVYDAVWAYAFGYAKALREAAVGAPDPRGPEVLEALASLPAFRGLSGEVSFDEWGDRKVPPGFEGRVLNLHPGEEGGNYTLVDVGVVRAGLASDGEGAELGPELLWPDGSSYPEVPGDSFGTTSLRPVIVGVSVSAGVLVLMSAALVARIWLLHRRIHVLVGESGALDLESPLQKILDFLKRHQGFHRRPSRREAASLHDYIIANARNLQAPDLAAQLKRTHVYSKGVTSYLLSFVAPNRDDDGSSQSSIATSMRRKDPAHDFVLEDVLIPSQRLLVADEVVVPREAADSIGHDFFLDTVSANSAIANSPSPLAAVFKQSLHALGLVSRIPSEANAPLMRYVLAIEDGYPDTLYHCKLHAADVVHRLATILKRSGIAAALEEDNWATSLAMLIAAVVHDYKHPQVTNNFLVYQEAEIAIQYNDLSVAENYALCESRRLLKEQELDFKSPIFCKDCTKERWKKFSNTVISSVLATDMARHFDILSRFVTLVLKDPKLENKTTSQKWKAMTDDQRTLSLQMAIKLADIGHNSLPIELSKLWVKRLQDENFHQGDLEARSGMRVSALMDRRKPGCESSHRPPPCSAR
uniref:3 5-cyclic nucleotide phosphodiesterase n=1 Tax=Tetraselmis sp. GSL018 TaxID=582737 RepID=A0A061RAD0_9CHLO